MSKRGLFIASIDAYKIIKKKNKEIALNFMGTTFFTTSYINI